MFNFFKKKTSINQTSHQTKHELRERKWKRIQRKELRWCVIRYYTLLDELNNVKSLYDVKRILNNWYYVEDTINQIKDFKINEHDFKVILRIISLKRYSGSYDYENLPDISIESYNQLKTLNTDPYRLTVYNNYESYWDEVLSNYKRNSDKRKRLVNLLENLDMDLSDPLILENQ